MGTTKHHAIVVTDSSAERINDLRDNAYNMFKEIVSPVIYSGVNNCHSFFVAPDGSNEGCNTSNEGDELRESFIKALTFSNADFVEVSFGGDFPSEAKLINKSGYDLAEQEPPFYY